MRKKVQTEARVLTTLTGRSGFYFIIATLLLAQSGTTDLLIGLYTFGLSIAMFVVGRQAATKLADLRSSMTNEVRARRRRAAGRPRPPRRARARAPPPSSARRRTDALLLRASLFGLFGSSRRRARRVTATPPPPPSDATRHGDAPRRRDRDRAPRRNDEQSARAFAEAELRAKFSHYDTDRDSKLSSAELANLCSELGSMLTHHELKGR